eukprot:Gb_02378 [translate_table: standard]
MLKETREYEMIWRSSLIQAITLPEETLMGIGDQYFEKAYSYIILYDFDGSSHCLSKYVDDCLAMCEIHWKIAIIHAKDRAHTKEVLEYKFEEVATRQYDPDKIFTKYYRLQDYHVIKLEDKYHNLVDYDWVAHKRREREIAGAESIEEETPQGESILNPWLVERKTIKVRYARPKAYKAKTKGSGDPYPRVKEIIDIRDSFILKKEFNTETYGRFITMRDNLFRKKATLDMVALENSIPSPSKEGGENFDPVILNQALKDRCKQNQEMEFVLRRKIKDVSLMERDFRDLYLRNKYFIVVKPREIQEKLWHLKELEAKREEVVNAKA